MQDTSLESLILWWLGIALQACIAYRILRHQSVIPFRFFGLYVALSVAFSLALNAFSAKTSNKSTYAYIFLVWTYSATIFEFFLIREVSSEALRRFPAIRIASRRTLNLFWAILIVVGDAWYLYLKSLPAQKFPLLYAALRYQESVALGFTLYILLFLAFVAWMPVPLPRNTLNHSLLTGALFLVVTLSRFAAELGDYQAQKHIVDLIGQGGTLLVFALWLLKIKISPDDTLNTPKGEVSTEDAKVMLARLEELNSTLSRSGPKALR
jgi:hypothetical protein